MNIDIRFSVTDSAAEELRKLIPEGSMIRIAAQSSGCSGTAYGLGIVEVSDVDSSSDVVEELGGVRFVVDRNSAMKLDGVTLDWHASEEAQGFKFVDPKSSSGCCRKGGCSS